MNNDEPTEDLPDGGNLDTSTTLTAIMKRFNELDDKLTTRMDNISKVMQAEFAAVNAQLASIDSHIDKLD